MYVDLFPPFRVELRADGGLNSDVAYFCTLATSFQEDR
jgi:hypothetical protein